MSDWIVGLTKAARSKGHPLTNIDWASVGAEFGFPVPEDLRELYETMDGADLPPDVTLFSLRKSARGPGMIERSRLGASAGVPKTGAWVFGQKGDRQYLFAARRKDLSPTFRTLPEWVAPLSADLWLFGRLIGPGNAKWYRSVELLLTRLVPPAETEAFGDLTFARALSAVRGALSSIQPDKTATKQRSGDAPKAKPAPKRRTASAKMSSTGLAKPAKRVKPAAKPGASRR